MARVDTHYVPTVTNVRRLAVARVEVIADRLRTTEANRFLLWLFALRLGPLRRIPEWLQASAEACKAAHPSVAADLLETAELERNHQRVVLEDLVAVLLRTPGVDFRALIRGPFAPQIEQHLRVRKLVPTAAIPEIVLAIDLELALLDRDAGAVLSEACGGAVGCKFLRLRQQTAERRIDTRLRQLQTVLDEQPEQAAASWATIANKVVLSYVDVLDAGAGRRPAPHSSPPDGPGTVWQRIEQSSPNHQQVHSW